MRRAAWLLIAMLVFSPVTASAKTTKVEIKPGKTVGAGYEHLKFTSKPDKRGLVWTIQEPLKSDDYWAVSVLNTSKKTVSGLCVKIEYEIGGQWYLSGMENAALWPDPYAIGPGEFATAVGDTMGFLDTDWDAVRLAPCDADAKLNGAVVDLSVRDFDFSGGVLTGTVVNDTKKSVRNIEVDFRCVDGDGTIYAADFFILDIRKLDQGKTEAFSEDVSDACTQPDDVIVSSLAIARGT